MESGSGESANKLVLESGLKEAEMPWARLHISPRVGLRTVACSDWWADG
jgi:hypothetical protein